MNWTVLITALYFSLTINNCSMVLDEDFPSETEDASPGTSVPLPDTSVSLPIGMNLPNLTYYTPALIFTDVMTTASDMITFYTDEPGSPWDSGRIGEITRDKNGYPTSLPQPTNSDGHETCVRFLINNYYQGRYRVFYEGEGTMVAGGNRLKSDEDGFYIDLDGSGNNTWFDITESRDGSYIRNIHIIPEEYGQYNSEDYDPTAFPTFLTKYTEGLEPFHVLRFMDWTRTNASLQVDWGEGSTENETPGDRSDDRITREYYTQGSGRGISHDYAIELCNSMQTDAWVCIPHMASDEYIRKMAELWHDNLDSNLKIYLEFSNEMWNWGFVQSRWILNNGVYGDYPEPVDSHVKADLEAIEAAGGNFPEKDAYMMARTFSIWADVFGGGMSSRVVRVATGQHAGSGNARRIMNYLNDPSEKYGSIGCDALAVGGYFSFSEENHNDWLSLGSSLTMDQIYSDTYEYFLETSKLWTERCSTVANDFDVDYFVYEGGQHMQPFNQKEWSYNPRLWEFQIHDDMYNLYFHNFDVLTAPDVNCTLFMAFSYVGKKGKPLRFMGTS